VKKNRVEARKVVLALLIFIGAVLPAVESFALDVILAWEPNIESTLAGYFVCYKEGSAGDPDEFGSYDVRIRVPVNDPGDPDSLADPSRPAFEIPGLDESKKYYFTVFAYDEDNLAVSKGSQEVFVICGDGIPIAYRKKYDRSWGISSGDLQGFGFLYSSAERVIPTFGSRERIPAFAMMGYTPVGQQFNLLVEPPQSDVFRFAVPVTLILPVPSGYDSGELSIGLYESGWAVAWDGGSKTRRADWDWLAADPVYLSVNPVDPDGPSVVELVVNHLSGVQIVQIKGDSGGGGGGCFISALYGE
jgi:hypothetical protein